MARKKREPGGERPKRRPQRPADLPDHRAMEGMMRDVVRSLQGQAHQHTPLDQAHEILLRAYQEPDEQRRVQLSKDALVLCPDCADAYVLPAEHATSLMEALRLYEPGQPGLEQAQVRGSAGTTPKKGPEKPHNRDCGRTSPFSGSECVGYSAGYKETVRLEGLL